MDIYIISPIINLVVATFVGGIIWHKSKNRALANTFGLFALSIAVWSLGYIFWQVSTTAQEALFWIRFFMAGAIFPTVFFYHFTLAFLDKTRNNNLFLYSGYVLMAFFFAANFTDLFVSGTEAILNFSHWPEPGVLFHPFLAVWLVFAVYAVYLLLRAYKKASNKQFRVQLGYLLFGVAVAYTGGITNYFLWYDIKVAPIGTVSTSIYLGSIAYAVAKHQLFNTKVILTEFFSWFLMSLLVINVFLSQTTAQLTKNIALVALVGVSVYSFVKSVYREVNAREEAEELTEELQHMNKQKSKMLSIASHQFRSPLTSIEGYTSLMKEGSYGEIPEHLEKPINRILKSSKKLAHIVDDFLNISRIEDGRMDYNFQEASIEVIIQEVIEEAETTAEEKDLGLQFEYDKNKGYEAEIDVGKFEQVITNLVDNAIKYTQKGEVTVSLDKKGDDIIVEVTDTGIGLAPEDTEGIFKQFSRADEAEEVNVVGSGLGLYIAKEIVEAHNGEIWATSPGKGEGSTFHVKLTKADQSSLDSDDGEDESEVEIN